MFCTNLVFECRIAASPLKIEVSSAFCNDCCSNVDSFSTCGYVV